MAFVNEYISPEDAKKYNLEDVDKMYSAPSDNWTIDKERNIYLRRVAAEREERQGYFTWNFFWEGELIEMVVYTSDISEDPSNAQITWNIERYGIINQAKQDAFIARKEEFFVLLKEALMTRQLGGVLMRKPPYEQFGVTIKVDPKFENRRGGRHG